MIQVLFHAGLCAFYDINVNENSGYATILADVTGKMYNDIITPMRWMTLIMLENVCNLNIMTLVSDDMTLLINDMSFCLNIHIQKMSYYDKNVIAQW